MIRDGNWRTDKTEEDPAKRPLSSLLTLRRVPCVSVYGYGRRPAALAYIKESALRHFNDILSDSYNEPNQSPEPMQLPDFAVWKLANLTVSSDSQHAPRRI
jgi:hypothetical protein